MIRDFLMLDRVTAVAPLGLRFREAASEALVDDGLIVSAYPAGDPTRRVSGFANRTGVYVLRNLPGLRDLEHGAGDAAYWAGLPAERPPFVVEVRDEQRRFQPFSFTAHPPERGLFAPEAVPLGSPLTAERSIPLFSAPSRLVPAGLAVVRAALWQPGHGGGPDRPAAWAVVEVTIAASRPGRPPFRARGVADERGNVAMVFPYPTPAPAPNHSPLGSPPDAERLPLARQTWPVALNAAYRSVDPPPAAPDLADLLAPLPVAGQLFEDAACTRPLAARELTFGRELVVKSAGEPAGPPPSVLFVTPVGSPP